MLGCPEDTLNFSMRTMYLLVLQWIAAGACVWYPLVSVYAPCIGAS